MVTTRTHDAPAPPADAARPRRTAAVLWLAAAGMYVGGEAVAAAAFPDYSYAFHYVSDLGIPTVEVLRGRPIDSPLHAVMNTAFIAQGVLFLLASILAVRSSRVRLRRSFLFTAVVFAAGSVLIAIVPGSQASSAAGIGPVHVTGAVLAIVGGNVAVILGGLLARGAGAPRVLFGGMVALGVTGILAAGMLVIDSSTDAFDLLPDGVWERIAIYTVTVWELLVGVSMLARSGRTRETS